MSHLGATRAPVSHQTVKLSRGKHSSPDQGVCVMELASMLAGEPFSDHPQAVCPVIGAFLRAYNDCVDGRRRQGLYAYAAKVVGTRSTVAVERDRAQLCREWARRVTADGGVPDGPSGPPHRPGRLRRWLQARRRREVAGRRAGMIFWRSATGDRDVLKLDDDRHRAALRLVDELIAVGRSDEPQLDDVARFAVQQQSAQT